MELWKEIVGYEGLYEVSNHGHVRSKDRFTKAKLGSKRLHKGRIISGGVNNRGYRLCLLYDKDGKRKTAYFHHLVLMAFSRERDEHEEACHNDGNKLNNNIDNLRWDNHVSNCKDREKHGTDTKGIKNGFSKLTEEDVLLIRSDNRRQRLISHEYNISSANVSMIKNLKAWKHV